TEKVQRRGFDVPCSEPESCNDHRSDQNSKPSPHQSSLPGASLIRVVLKKVAPFTLGPCGHFYGMSGTPSPRILSYPAASPPRNIPGYGVSALAIPNTKLRNAKSVLRRRTPVSLCPGDGAQSSAAISEITDPGAR